MHRISCPTKDVSAADLGVRWNGPLPEVLAEDTVIHNSYRLHLGVIGASHVVTVTSVSAPDQPLFREEISCTARSKGQPLPMYAELPGYRLQSAISTLDDAAFRNQAEHIAALDTLVVQFPGEGDFHITALGGAPTEDGLEWASYHVYPSENTIVTTWSRFNLA